MLPTPLVTAPSRHAVLSAGIAWLIISLGLLHAGACVYILLFGLEARGALAPDANPEVSALRLPTLDIASLRWLVASSAALALAMTLLAYLSRQARAGAHLHDPWGLAWPGMGNLLSRTRGLAAAPAPLDRPGVIAVRIGNLDAIVNVHGRAVAQRALRATAKALRESARKSDIVTRTAHDRFAVVLSHTDPNAMSVTAARLRGAIAALAIAAPGGRTVLVEARLGWSSGDGHDLGALLDLANAALHDARRETVSQAAP